MSASRPIASAYDERSLRHELKMAARYRQRAQNDGTLLQPWANACLRAASFEWVISGEVAKVRAQWREAARALAEGFARRPQGFDPRADQLMLGLHLAIAAREGETFSRLAYLASGSLAQILRHSSSSAHSPALDHLAEGYALISLSLVERRYGPARAAVSALTAARELNEFSWWAQHFPDPLEAAWLFNEHEAICLLLGAVAEVIIADEQRRAIQADIHAARFAAAIDESLLRLDKFTAMDENHHPKLYVWLPGLALCALAASAGLPVEWIRQRHAHRVEGYLRLPLALLRNEDSLHANEQSD